MRPNIGFHIDGLEKTSEGKAIVDIENGVDNHEDSWAELLDKG